MGDVSQLSEFLTADEAASWLKLSRSQIYKLVHRAKKGDGIPIPFLRIGASVRFRRSDLEAWLTAIQQS